MDTHSPPPPTPPAPPLPLPPSLLPRPSSKPLNKTSRVSPFIQKLQSAPAGYWFEPSVHPKPIDPLAPRTGLYFFYGTLMDPSLLSEILELPHRTPKLRPAQLIGFKIKLWGQYPALVGGFTGAVVDGMVYEVESEAQAERLAEYETRAYEATPCRIRFTDGEEPVEASGTTFEYGGNPLDISEGEFDLGIWLRRMGRERREGESGKDDRGANG